MRNLLQSCRIELELRREPAPTSADSCRRSAGPNLGGDECHRRPLIAHQDHNKPHGDHQADNAVVKQALNGDAGDAETGAYCADHPKYKETHHYAGTKRTEAPEASRRVGRRRNIDHHRHHGDRNERDRGNARDRSAGPTSWSVRVGHSPQPYRSSCFIESDPGFGSRGLRGFATSQTSRGPVAATDNGAHIRLLRGHPEDHYAWCFDSWE
jgi:hypothetical protein